MSLPPDHTHFFSQSAFSPDEETSARPLKRPRTQSQSVVLSVDEQPSLTQISPSKPPRRPQRLLLNDLGTFADSDDQQYSTYQADQHGDTSSSIPSSTRKPRIIPWRGPPVEKSTNNISEAIAAARARVNANELSIELPCSVLSSELQSVQPANEPPIAESELHDSDIPSPPESFSSEERQPEIKQEDVKPEQVISHDEHAMPKKIYKPPVWDSFEPTIMSQDSAYFSFSKSQHDQTLRKLENCLVHTIPKPEPVILPSTNDIDHDADEDAIQSNHQPKKYYTKAFDYVINQVLARYSDILHSSDVELAALFQDELSPNAQALFVRVYRRKQPHWYRLSALNQSYGEDINIEEGVAELCNKRLVLSSAHAAKSSKVAELSVSKQLITSLDLPELRATCTALVEGKQLKKLPKARLLPALRSVLSDTSSGKKRPRHRQTTLTGLSPALCLSRAILKRVGHSIKIPEFVLTPLQRIHRLFFLEDGPDSANIILADTGKVKYPNYICAPINRIFPSSFAFIGYEIARDLEAELDAALELKDFQKAVNFGSIAELEVREFFGSAPDFDKSNLLQDEQSQRWQDSSSLGQAGVASERPARRKQLDHRETTEQLKHPFFRRYTAQWVYVRACWRSVHALERMSEFENAISRLRLLLSTGLMPRTRGKCLNRLTINLFKHMGKLEEALQVILSALESKIETLHFGDLVGLANRGLQIHRKLKLPEAEANALLDETLRTKASRKKAALQAVIESRPVVLTRVLSRHETKVAVRKIYGKSLHVISREENKRLKQRSQNIWQTFNDEASRDSVETASTQGKSFMGKSIFSSFRSAGGEVSVEEYAMEWYLGKEGWQGVHDEGKSIRFLFCLFMWDCALFADVPDVFQTPYQDKPLDLFTESFYPTRRIAIDERISEIECMSADELRTETVALYESHFDERCFGCAWSTYSAEDLSIVAGGLGGVPLSHCLKLLALDYAYWGAGLPDLTLWKLEKENASEVCRAKLVEVKSARDMLSEKQKAWLLELQSRDTDCEVCKVVERVTTHNEVDLQDAKLDSVEINAIDLATNIEND